MKWLDKMQYKYGRHALRNLMLYIVCGMALVYMLDLVFASQQAQLGLSSVSGLLAFDFPAICRGEVWRLISFIFIPPNANIVFILFSLYFYWMIGTALETEWGSFKFNTFYIVGILGTIIAGMIVGYVDNYYLNLSLFLAFALIYPNFELRIFFIIPVKVKWLAWLDAAFLAVMMVLGGWAIRAAIIVSLLNILLFFFNDFAQLIKRLTRRSAFKNSVHKGEVINRQSRDYWQNR